MFHTLETTWDQSARRRWTTVVSFTLQAMASSLLLAIPLLTIQGPPRLQWFDPRVLAPPAAPAPPPPPGQRSLHPSGMRGGIVLQPPTIPLGIAAVNDADMPTAPDVSNFGIRGGTGRGGLGIAQSVGDATPVPPPTPAPTRPLRVSNWAEGNLIYRVQPAYPLLAREARIQGTVLLRAIISKTGTIENLMVLNGHPLLVRAVVDAVQRWRYRPYMLNGEPIEVETEITVNFTLAGN